MIKPLLDTNTSITLAWTLTLSTGAGSFEQFACKRRYITIVSNFLCIYAVRNLLTYLVSLVESEIDFMRLNTPTLVIDAQTEENYGNASSRKCLFPGRYG